MWMTSLWAGSLARFEVLDKFDDAALVVEVFALAGAVVDKMDADSLV